MEHRFAVVLFEANKSFFPLFTPTGLPNRGIHNEMSVIFIFIGVPGRSGTN